MTFEEWWEKIEKDEEIKNREVIYKNEILAHDAWRTAQREQFLYDTETSQLKWTLCRDKLPDTEGYYLWLHADNSIHVYYYWTDTKLMSYVIAWIPIPE